MTLAAYILLMIFAAIAVGVGYSIEAALDLEGGSF